MQAVQITDVSILEMIQQHWHSGAMDQYMILVTTLGNKGGIWIAVSLVMLFSKRHRKTGVLMAAALVLSALLGEGVLKHWIGRPRPFVSYPEFSSAIVPVSGYSFPSGHTASSFAAAGVLVFRKEAYRIWAVILGILIAFSRVYLFVHYPSDIAGGIILGALCAWTVSKGYEAWMEKKD